MQDCIADVLRHDPRTDCPQWHENLYDLSNLLRAKCDFLCDCALYGRDFGLRHYGCDGAAFVGSLFGRGVDRVSKHIGRAAVSCLDALNPRVDVEYQDIEDQALAIGFVAGCSRGIGTIALLRSGGHNRTGHGRDIGTNKCVVCSPTVHRRFARKSRALADRRCNYWFFGSRLGPASGSGQLHAFCNAPCRSSVLLCLRDGNGPQLRI